MASDLDAMSDAEFEAHAKAAGMPTMSRSMAKQVPQPPRASSATCTHGTSCYMSARCPSFASVRSLSPPCL